MKKTVDCDGIQGMSCTLLYQLPNRFPPLSKDAEYDILTSSDMEKVTPIDEDYYSGINNESILRGLLSKYAALDQALEKIRQKQNVQYVCAQGCNECCKDYFYISMVEYFLIKYTLITQGIFEKIRTLGEQQYLQLRHDVNSEYENLEHKNTNANIIWKDHMHTKRFLLCPLNDHQGHCVVYQVRPIICRLYGRTNDFLPCDIIQKTCKSFFSPKLNEKKLHKHILNVRVEPQWLEEDNGFIQVGEQTIVQRPYPLIYWLAHDATYSAQYLSATNGTRNDFAQILLFHHLLE